MRLAVLSDIHNQTDNLIAILSRMRSLRPDALILCGDLTEPKVLEICKASVGRLSFCLGNCDRSSADALRDSALVLGAGAWDSVGLFPLDEGGSVAFTHFPATARRSAMEGGHAAVFYGHTHKPAQETLRLGDGGGVLLANPGDVQGRYRRVGGLVWDSLSGALTWCEL
jgi:putative phosphoesterase